MTTARDEKKNAIHDALMRILEREGEIKPDHVIEEARNPESPLHDQFEWDLEQAAMEAWRSQARRILSEFTIIRVVNRTEYRVAEFVENPLKPERQIQGYVSFDTVASNPEMAQRFLDRELGIANTYIQKANNYAAVLGLAKKVKQVSRAIEAIRKTAKINGNTLQANPSSPAV